MIATELPKVWHLNVYQTAGGFQITDCVGYACRELCHQDAEETVRGQDLRRVGMLRVTFK